MAKFFPEPVPYTDDMAFIREFLGRQFNLILAAFEAVEQIELAELAIEPERPRVGMIKFADGVNWDPGQGIGFYGYNGTSWNKLDLDSTDDPTFDTLRLLNTTDISSLSSTGHAFQIGPDNGVHLAVDTNEIQARNNGAVGTLLLNDLGGNINMFGNGSGILNTAGEIVSTVGNEALDLRSLNVGAGAVYIRFRDSAGTAIGYIGLGSSSNDIYGIVRNVAGEIQLDPGSGGTFNLVRGQIQFPATQNASSDVNTLDDYEEGTWTPTVAFTTPGDTSITYSTQIGRYIKIGKLVYLQFVIVTSAFTHTTASGEFRISGVPFAHITSANSDGVGAFEVQGFTFAAGRTAATANMPSGASYVRIVTYGSGVNRDAADAAEHTSGTNISLVGNIVYEATA